MWCMFDQPLINDDWNNRISLIFYPFLILNFLLFWQNWHCYWITFVYLDVSDKDELGEFDDELDELDEWRTIFNLFDVDGDQAITKEVKIKFLGTCRYNYLRKGLPIQQYEVLLTPKSQDRSILIYQKMLSIRPGRYWFRLICRGCMINRTEHPPTLFQGNYFSFLCKLIIKINKYLSF